MINAFRLLALAILFLPVIGTTGHAADPWQAPRQAVKLKNLGTGQYLAVSGGQSHDGANVIQWSDERQADLRFTFRGRGGGEFLVESRNLGRYLAVAGGSRINGGNVIIWRNQGQRDVAWQPISTGGQCFKLRNVNSGLFLAVAGGVNRRGANVIQWQDVNQRDIIWCWEN